MLRKIHSEGFGACPYGSSVLPSGRCHPGRPQIQPSPRDSAQHGRGQKVITSTLQASNTCFQGQLEAGISALTAHQTRHILAAAASRSRDTAMESPGSRGARVPSLAQAPGALHKTLDKQQHKQDQKLLTHHKAAEELTPAFSFSSVYISVKYIIYNSIGLIVIYYSLELLLSFPYFNHIYASNFAYRSYCLEFIIEIHRIKLK